MLIPLFCLSLGSIFIGYLSRDMFIGLGTSFWNNSLFILPVHEVSLIAEFGVPVFIKLIPVIFSLFGGGLAFFLFSNKQLSLFSFSRSLGYPVYVFLSKKWFFDKINNEVFSQFFLDFG
jgi:NADH-ubiquinone oxidoreductase chain 5